MRRQEYIDPPPIFRVSLPLDEPGCLATVDQANHRLMLQLEGIGDLAEVGALLARLTLETQEKLVLLGRESYSPSPFL